MKTLIHVTQDDIDRGERINPRSCPIARAIQRTLVLRTRPYVCLDCIEIEQIPGGCKQRIDTPVDAENFIQDFDDFDPSDDDDSPPPPFSFWCDIPEYQPEEEDCE